MFATDSPWKDQKREVEHVKGLRLSEEEKEKIFWKNAQQLLGLKIVYKTS